MSRRMYFYVIVIGAFVLALVYMGYKNRNGFLDKITWLPGEKVLLTDDVKFTGYFRGTKQIKSNFPFGHIVITNQRLLLTQKTIWGGRFKIDYAVDYTHKGEPLSQADMMGGGLFKLGTDGFFTFYTTLDRITSTTENSKPIVQVTVPFPDHGPLMAEPRFVIYTGKGSQYLTLIK